MSDFKLTAMQIAEMLHSVTSKIQRMDGSTVESWEELSEENKRLSTKAVREIYNRPQMTAEQLHNLWMKLKLEDNWECGPEYDSVNKKHPCIVPFVDLPLSERCKDLIWEHLPKALFPFFDSSEKELE